MNNENSETTSATRRRPVQAKLPGSETMVPFTRNDNNPLKIVANGCVIGTMVSVAFNNNNNNKGLFGQVKGLARLRGATGSTNMIVQEYGTNKTYAVNWRLGVAEVSDIREIFVGTKELKVERKVEVPLGFENLGGTDDTHVLVARMVDPCWMAISAIQIPDMNDLASHFIIHTHI